MIEIALGKWGYFDQIIFNAKKMAFENLFCFSQAPLHYYIKLDRTQALKIARLDPDQGIS